MEDVRLALVVGGASGIGAACAAALRRDGRHVIVADRTQPADLTFDVRDSVAVAAGVRQLVGDRTLDAVVYAAGTARPAPLDEITDGDWRLVLDVNLTGAFHVVRAVLPLMPGGGSIVLVSSVDAVAPVSGLASYCAAKAGLEALSRSVALEFGHHGVRCNAIAPGVVRTPLMAKQLEDPALAAAFAARTPLGGIADPEEVADVAAFLVSPGARWITGARVPVDGGLSLREHPTMLRKQARS